MLGAVQVIVSTSVFPLVNVLGFMHDAKERLPKRDCGCAIYRDGYADFH
jgi:hypothetical protein